jgi:hypothetical protein
MSKLIKEDGGPATLATVSGMGNVVAPQGGTNADFYNSSNKGSGDIFSKNDKKNKKKKKVKDFMSFISTLPGVKVVKK